ncbi:MAG TPA: hypothetical protein VGB71_06925, partial [Flavisolibacter sp.]
MYSCSKTTTPSFQLLQTKHINFPSASAAEFYKNRLFVFGDDAPYLLILSPNYDALDSVVYLPNVTGRIPKEEKPDIESTTISIKNGEAILYAFGSMSTEKRAGMLEYNPQTRSMKAAGFLPSNMVIPGISALNIEGSCTVKDRMVFSNRANIANPINHLVFINPDSSTTTKKISLPAGKLVAGLSGLYYAQEKDLLLFTASEEETASTFKDGAIGDSYLGWIENFSSKMNANEFIPDQYVKLSSVNKAFAK